MFIKYYCPLCILLSLYTGFIVADKERGWGSLNYERAALAGGVGGSVDVGDLVYFFLFPFLLHCINADLKAPPPSFVLLVLYTGYITTNADRGAMKFWRRKGTRKSIPSHPHPRCRQLHPLRPPARNSMNPNLSLPPQQRILYIRTEEYRGGNNTL